MNSSDVSTPSRFERLSRLLAQDPANLLLLADAFDAAMSEGALDQAEQIARQGADAEDQAPAWRFRLASLRIAQRRLGEARTLLEGLRSESMRHPSVDHNLAYVALLEGDFAACAQWLAPWMADAGSAGREAAAIEALWLRAAHGAGQLREAWEWAEQRGLANLGPAAAGVASLIAIDLSKIDAAEQLSATALRADPSQAEALVASACVAMARRRLPLARQLLSAAVTRHAHQARAWSTLGFVDLLEMKLPQAREHFDRAIALSPHDDGTLVGLGWTCVLQADLDAARRTFQAAVAADEQSADGHGGLAVVLALQGESAAAATHADLAKRLQPGNVAARYAHSILTGNTEGLRGVQKMAQQLLRGAAKSP